VAPGPVSVGFDEVGSGPSGQLSVSLWQGNAGRPVWTYWFPLLCLLFPEVMRPAPVSDPDMRRRRYVYPVELRFEADEWSVEAASEELIAVLPPQVERAVAAGRALVLVSIAHEGRPLFPLGGHGHGRDHPLSVLDRVAAFASWYGLSPDDLWFLTGNLDAQAEADAWREHRGLDRLPFTFRVCEPFSAFVGGCVRESLRHGRAPVADVTFARQGAHSIGWRGVRVGWTASPFPGLAGERATEPARFRYACLNRMFRPHRWQVLTRLWREGLLGEGLVSFPRPGPDELSELGIDGTGATERQLLGLLPLTADRPQRFDDASFFSENSAFVMLHPPVVLRECALEVVTETRHSGGLFVSEKAFKSLLGRGPAVIAGTRGTLDYLRSLGARTWPDYLDESYDQLADERKRLTAALDSAVELARHPRWATVDAHAARVHNLQWLTDARKPWDDLATELAEALSA
jgi:hypothetical protein